MECPNCGLLNPDASLRCDCGYEFHDQPHQPQTNESADALQIEPPALPAGTQASASRPNEPPYAQFSLWLLGSFLLACSAVFLGAESLSRGGSPVTLLLLAAAVLCALLARSAWRVWRRVVVEEPESNATFRQRHRNVMVASLAIVLVFAVIAGTAGTAIGHKREKGQLVARINAHLHRYESLANQIVTARNAVDNNVQSYIQMYETIEPEVLEYEPLLRQLRAELGRYDPISPGEHERTSENIADIEKELRRIDLLKQQIAVAKQLGSLDPSQRQAAWKVQMQPLLEKEDELDHPSEGRL